MIRALLWLWIPRGLFNEGAAWAERALQRTAATSVTREYALILDAIGWLALVSGDYAAALRHCEQARSVMEQAGTASELAHTKLALGIAAATLGRVPDGTQLLHEALAMYRDLSEPYGTALALIALGEGARACGDERRAAECHEEALSLLRASGNVYWPGQLLQTLAHFRLHEGDWKGACVLLAEALELAREYDYPRVVKLYVAAMGAVAMARGRALEGAQLFGAVSAAQQLLGALFEANDQQELERHMAAARGALGDEAFERAFAEGSHWSLDQAVAATLPLRG
jgi:tetratricopeptide (TPR) repeat protein